MDRTEVWARCGLIMKNSLQGVGHGEFLVERTVDTKVGVILTIPMLGKAAASNSGLSLQVAASCCFFFTVRDHILSLQATDALPDLPATLSDVA